MTLRLQLVPLCGGLLLVFASAALAQGEYQQTRDSKTMVWNGTPKPGEMSSWAGGRDKENYANGFGDLTWYTANGKEYVRYYGNMVHGKFEGAVNAHTNGRTVHAYFVDGGRVTGWAHGPAPSRMNLPEAAIIEKRKAAAEKIAAAEKLKSEPEKHLAAVAPETATKPKAEPEKVRSIASKSGATPAPVAPAPTPPTAAKEKIALAREKTENAASVFEPTPIPTKSEAGTQKSEISGSTESSVPALDRPVTETTTQPSTQEAPPVAEGPAQNEEVSSLPPGNQPSAAKSDGDVSLSTLVDPPSFLRATSIPETATEKTERSTSSASSADKLTEAEAISLADAEARIQGYHVDEYQRPKVDHSAVKGKWALFYSLKQDADAQGNPSAFTVTIEDQTKKVEIRK